MVACLRLLLWPFSLLFGIAVVIRRWAFGAFRGRYEAPVPTVAVGNLSAGGTGKTPHAAMIAEILMQHGKRTAWLSRGYGRKTSGFREVLYSSRASETGDEPLMVKHRFPDMPVFVCENRKQGIREILSRHPETEVLVLDDAFQHLAVKPKKAIVLLTYESLKKPWLLLPAGNAREPLSALRHADLVLVTKCPAHIGKQERALLQGRIRKYFPGQVFFSHYRYTDFWNASGLKPLGDKVYVISGIAGPEPLRKYLKTQFSAVHAHFFPDHHPFRKAELKRVFQKAGNAPVVTTEKDLVRMTEVWPEILGLPNFFIIPLVPELGESKRDFEKWLISALFSEGKK